MSKKDNQDSAFQDIPLGLGMALVQDTEAMQYYSNLDSVTKQGIAGYIQSSESGEEAKKRVRTVVDNLKQHNTNFIG